MAGLLDSFLPEDEVKRNAALQGALSAGLGIMANAYNPGGRFGPAIGAGGLQGLQAYQEAIQNANANQIRQMQIDEMKRQQSQRVKQEQALATAPREIQEAVALGVPVSEIWKRNNPERKWVEGFDAQGRPVKGFFDGSNFVPVGGSQAKPVEWKDVGGKLVATDPYTGMPIQNVEMGKTVSPDTAYSGGITLRGQNLADARARESLAAPTFHDGAWVYKPSQAIPQGGSVRIPGFEKAGNPTEGERKAATLLKRMEGSLSQLNAALAANPDVAKPSAVGNLIESIPLVGAPLGNLVTRSDRQRVEAAQLDILDAALTLGTGAAYTKEQLEGYRKSYFPQVGDGPDVIRDKQARLENVLGAARVAAGRAAPAASQGNDLAAAAAAELERRKGGRK